MKVYYINYMGILNMLGIPDGDDFDEAKEDYVTYESTQKPMVDFSSFNAKNLDKARRNLANDPSLDELESYGEYGGGVLSGGLVGWVLPLAILGEGVVESEVVGATTEDIVESGEANVVESGATKKTIPKPIRIASATLGAVSGGKIARDDMKADVLEDREALENIMSDRVNAHSNKP